MKRKLTTIIGIILILIGLVIAALPYFQSYVMQRQSQQILELVEEISADEMEKNQSSEAEHDWSQIENIGFDDFDPITEALTELNIIEVSRRLNYNKDGTFRKDQLIGQIVIPDLSINLALFSGITNGNLLYGVSNMKPNQKLGERNYAIAGHIAYSFNTLFTHLPNAKKGMIVRVTDKKNIYYYKIYETKIVDASAVYMVEDREASKRGNPIISLMSCVPRKNHLRFFALGDLVDVQPYSNEAMITKEADSY